MAHDQSWHTHPRGMAQPAPDDTVQVLMTEEMARRFEIACLGDHTRAPTYLAGPIQFMEDDLPTYIIGVEIAADDREGDR